MALKNRIKKAWNALLDRNQVTSQDLGVGSYYPQQRSSRGLASSNLANTVFNRIALDASMVDILHVKVDQASENQTRVDSTLQERLTTEANIDQTGPAFIHDLVYSILDEGVAAAVPIETSIDIKKTDSYDIYSMRVGRITQWYPKFVTVEVWDEISGNFKQTTLPKSDVAIIENPLYEIVNRPNGTLSRLNHKMTLLDKVDEDTISNKLNMILQLPYAVRSDLKRQQAQQRIDDLEKQLSNSEYGIGYVDGTEKITQLSRPVGTNLSEEVKYLTEQFYNSLGLTQNVFNGTASELEMRSYYSRAVDPIISRIVAEFNRKFLTKTARAQGQELIAYRDPFKLVPVDKLAEIADTFSRNAILTPNEIRKIIGFGPSSDPKADELSNKNIADANQDTADPSTSMGPVQESPFSDGG
jgi:hypothetical protein